MLEKENEIRDILKKLEQLDKDAYHAAEKRNAAKTELLEKQAQTERARGMTVRVGAFAGISAAAIAITLAVLRSAGI